MPEISTLRKTAPERTIPSGEDSLWVRERYLRRRSRRERINDRAFTALWVALGAVISWIFVIGFTAFAH